MFDFDFCNALPVRARVGSGTITAIYYYYYYSAHGVDNVQFSHLMCAVAAPVYICFFYKGLQSDATWGLSAGSEFQLCRPYLVFSLVFLRSQTRYERRRIQSGSDPAANSDEHRSSLRHESPNTQSESQLQQLTL